jgi:hypothetical protein
MENDAAPTMMYALDPPAIHPLIVFDAHVFAAECPVECPIEWVL